MAARSRTLHDSQQRWMEDVKQEVSRAFEQEDKFRSIDRKERMQNLRLSTEIATLRLDRSSR